MTVTETLRSAQGDSLKGQLRKINSIHSKKENNGNRTYE